MIMNRMASPGRCGPEPTSAPVDTTNVALSDRQPRRAGAKKSRAQRAASGVAGGDLADLDAAPLGGGAFGGDRERFVLGRRIEQEEAADHLLGLGERAVDDVLAAV